MSIYEVMPTISTSFIVISAILVAFGWRLAVKRRLESHKKVMLAGAISALLFFIIYMTRTILVGNTTWGGPDHLKTFYVIFLVFHIVLATVGAVFGLTTLTLAFRNRFVKHRKWGRVTSVIWFFTAITGVMVYVLLYMLYPGGHTAPMINDILG